MPITEKSHNELASTDVGTVNAVVPNFSAVRLHPSIQIDISLRFQPLISNWSGCTSGE